MRKYFVIPLASTIWNEEAIVESIYSHSYDTEAEAEKACTSFALQYNTVIRV